MNDWGTPDWTCAAGYVFPDTWHKNRWRWEFLRRRSDLRAEFDQKKSKEYERKLAFREYILTVSTDEQPHLPNPDEAGFFVTTNLIGGEDQYLPNPRIGDQPWTAISWLDSADRWCMHDSTLPPEGYLRFDFDLSRPIEAQLAMAKDALIEFQLELHGKKLQSRNQRLKWPSYLRVLDAKEAGASWAEIAPILVHSAQTPQSARDAHNQALALCFNSWN